MPKKSGKMSMDLNCVSFSKVLVLWRPWENCPRCKIAMGEGKIEFPEEGDYVCPHTQEKEYKRIKDLCLCGEAVLQKEEFFNVRSTDARCVHILWWCLDEASLKRMNAKKTGDVVYPPNPEAVFAKGREEDKAKAAKKTRGVSKELPT
jgi:rubredoxin